MRFAAPSRPTICAPSSRPAAPLGDDLHRDRLRARVVAAPASWTRSSRSTKSNPASVASCSLSPVRPTSYAQIFVTAVPITPREPRVAAGDVDADDPALLVRVRAERDRDRPAADAVVGLDAVARGPHAVDARRHARRRSRCRPLADRDAGVARELDVRAARRGRARRGRPAIVPVAGRRRRAHGRRSSVSNASTLRVGVQLDAEAADRVGNERAHVGIERGHRLRPGLDDRDRAGRAGAAPRPSRARRNPPPTTTARWSACRRAPTSVAQRDAVGERLHPVHASASTPGKRRANRRRRRSRSRAGRTASRRSVRRRGRGP